jgi:hypothetical protein
VQSQSLDIHHLCPGQIANRACETKLILHWYQTGCRLETCQHRIKMDDAAGRQLWLPNRTTLRSFPRRAGDIRAIIYPGAIDPRNDFAGLLLAALLAVSRLTLPLFFATSKGSGKL